MVARAGEHRERRVQQAYGLLVLGLGRVVGDVPGDQQRVDRVGEGPQMVHDAGGPPCRAFTAVQVQIADLSKQHVRPSPIT